MVRFWPTLGIACLLALIGYGLISALNGRMVNIEGQWLGNFPLPGGNDCRLKLYPTSSFDLECRGNTTYAARGTWRQWEDNLEMKFTFYAKDAQFPKRMPEPWLFYVKAGRNELNLGLRNDHGFPYKWRRASL